jgi:hypothetical protein
MSKKLTPSKIQQLRDAGWTVGTADEFVDSLSVTDEQRDLLNSLLETGKEFFENPTQETYEKSIKAYREITGPIANIRGGIFHEILNNKWCRRQLRDNSYKLASLMADHNIKPLGRD